MGATALYKEERQDICVYFHRKLTNREVFYVGIGVPERPDSFRGRNKFWRSTVKKHGYYTEVISENLTWDEACKIEIYWIAKIGRRNKGLGPLVNLTDGGDGSLGYIPTEETKNKIRIPVNQYDIGGKFIKTWLSAKEAYYELGIFDVGKCCKGKVAIAGGFQWRYNNGDLSNISRVREKQIYQYNFEGKFLKKWSGFTDIINYYNCSKDTIINGLEDGYVTRLGYVWSYDELDYNLFFLNRRCVLQYTHKGLYVAAYASVLQAAEAVNTSFGNIYGNLKGKEKQAAGYVWRFKEAGDEITKVIEPPRLRESKKIYQYDSHGVFIKEWISVRCASEELCLNQEGIKNCANGFTKYSGGFIWKYYYKKEIEGVKLHTTKVDKLDLEGNYICTYNSLTEAAKDVSRDTSRISSCVRGIKKTAGGYKWKYSEV